MIVTIHNEGLLYTIPDKIGYKECEIKLTEKEFTLMKDILEMKSESNLNRLQNVNLSLNLFVFKLIEKQIIEYNKERTKTYVSLKKKIKTICEWMSLAIKDNNEWFLSVTF